MAINGRIGAALALSYAWFVGAQEVDYAQFVNPFIGSEGGIKGYACERFLLTTNQLYR